MNYKNIIDLRSLQSFSYIYKHNGAYIVDKRCNNKIQNCTSDTNLLSLSSGEFKNKYNYICKKTHEYRIENLYQINKNNLYDLFKYISSAYIVINSNLTFQVSSCKNSLKMLEYFIENKLPLYINQIIKTSLKDNTDNEAFLAINIDNKKIKQISNNDFHIILKKALAKVQHPKEIKYFSDVITTIATKVILSDKQIAYYQQEIVNKIILGIKHILNYREENANYNSQEILYKIHSLICLVKYKKIALQANIKKKLTKEIMFLFNEFIRNINFSIPDLNIIKNQRDNIDVFINSIIHVLIKYIAKDPDTFLANITNMQLKLKNKANSILQQAAASTNSLLYYRDTIDTSMINISGIIKHLIELDLNVQNIIDDQKKITSEDTTNINTTTFHHLVKERKLLVLMHNKKNDNLNLTNYISKLKKETSHLFATCNSYNQEYNIFNKHIDYYKNSIDNKNLKYYQTLMMENLIDYLKNTLYMLIKKKIKRPDITPLKETIDNALPPEVSDAGKVIIIAIMYYAKDILVDNIVIDINDFISKIKELQQQNIMANILHEHTCLIEDE